MKIRKHNGQLKKNSTPGIFLKFSFNYAFSFQGLLGGCWGSGNILNVVFLRKNDIWAKMQQKWEI